MSLVGIGLVLLLVGVLLWFTVAPGVGGALILIGAIVAIVGVVLDHRRV